MMVRYFSSLSQGGFGGFSLVDGKLGVRSEQQQQGQYRQPPGDHAHVRSEQPAEKVHVVREEDIQDRIEDGVKDRQGDADEHHLVPEAYPDLWLALGKGLMGEFWV